ncbi:hypothetical protein [Galbibacter mesophilus]|uniref:hypothetical protein n=1 Tax=Galbibacter mesophilus TaxID=379069 RepID=UPI00191F45F1|nr:hypothetical protein [Galbibacter mesophilus]MCM5662046.1 hypothetical protein [Galbibacter mesophilus]
MSKEKYENKLPILKEIPSSEVKLPNMPIDAFLQEAEDLYVWVQQDKHALGRVGLQWKKFVEDLPNRTGALRYTQSLWVSERYGRDEARREWDLLAPGAYKLRDDLLDAFRFAYRQRQDVLNRVKEIAEGNGHPDMIQDLSDLASLGMKNLQELQKIKLDMMLFNKAAATATHMADLLAKSNESTADNTEEKDMRDRAYTHAYEAVSEIRATGKYVFRDNEIRRKGYLNKYMKRYRLKK